MGEKAGHRSGKSRRESQSWVQPGPGSGDNSPERQKPLAFGSEEDGNVSRPVLNISLKASHDSVEADVSPRLQVPQRLPIPCRAHGEGLVLHGAVSATPPPATRSLGPAPRLGPPLTSPLPRPRTPGSLPPLPLSAGGAPSAQNTVPQTPARLTPSAPSGPCAKGIFSVRMSPVISGSIASLCVSISNVLHDGLRCYVNNKPERLFSLPVYPQEQRETSGTCSVLIY